MKYKRVKQNGKHKHMLLVVKINIVSWNIYDRLCVYFIFMHGMCEESVTK